jgi:hypothetical protein
VLVVALPSSLLFAPSQNVKGSYYYITKEPITKRSSRSDLDMFCMHPGVKLEASKEQKQGKKKKRNVILSVVVM